MNGTDTPNADEVAELLPSHEMLQVDGFDEAVIGYAEVWSASGEQQHVMAYDRDKCIDILVERDGMEWPEAREYFEFNVTGTYVGEMTPVFVSRVIDQ